MMNASDKLNS